MTKKKDMQIISFEGAAYTAPEAKEITRGSLDFVEYNIEGNKEKKYKNNYFRYLQERALYSNTNKTLIDSIVQQTVGKGLDALDSGEKLNEYLKFKTFNFDSWGSKVAQDRYTYGMAAIAVTLTRGVPTDINHWPMETLRSGLMNDEGIVEEWYYHHNWEKKKMSEDPDQVFKSWEARGDRESGTVIYIVKKYVPFYYYYAPPDWSGALPYCVAEEEIGDFLVNEVKNSFSGTKLITFTSGKLPPEQARIKANEFKKTQTGATGAKLAVAFVNGQEQLPQVDDMSLGDAPEHYNYLSTEARNKILEAHKAPSWLLGTNNGGNGLSSNADEIKNAMLVFDNLVVKPNQKLLLDAYKAILYEAGITLDLYYRTIQPLEFIETDGLDSETKEEETGVKQETTQTTFSDEKYKVLKDFIEECGTDGVEGYEMIEEQEVDFDLEDKLDQIIKEANEAAQAGSKQSKFSKLMSFLSTGSAAPNRASEQDKVVDGSLYKVRYKYVGETTDKTRPFCRLMVNASKVYRKEDIVRMGSMSVNPGWGPGGVDTYDIFKYKGGGNCHHKWMRQTFKIVDRERGSIYGPNAEQVSTNQAEREGYRVRNPKEVAMKPKDMPNNGFLN